MEKGALKNRSAVYSPGNGGAEPDFCFSPLNNLPRGKVRDREREREEENCFSLLLLCVYVWLLALLKATSLAHY